MGLRIVDSKYLTVEIGCYLSSWGIGFHWYFNMWLTFYFYLGPIRLDVGTTLIKRKCK